MSRTASIKNAACRENREIRDAIAYRGTMSMIRMTMLRARVSACAAIGVLRDVPLKMGFPVITQVQHNRCGRHHCRNDSRDACEDEHRQRQR